MTVRPRRVAAVPRVVFDTNVVLSALVFGGEVSARVRAAWHALECVPLICNATAQELVRALAYPKFKLDAPEREELLADYLPFADVVRIPDPPPKTPPCRDPDDQVFLQLAVAGRASALVTGDKDLLVLAGRVKFAILAPQAWLKTLSP